MIQSYLNIRGKITDSQLIYLFALILLSNSLNISNDSTLDRPGQVSVSGCVVAQEITPRGVIDFPTRHTYEVELTNGSLVYVTYTSYPPSPFGDMIRDKISLNFVNGTVLPGDHILAYGNYVTKTNTLTISTDGDFIVTYSGGGCG